MEPIDEVRGIQETDSAKQPWIVLVQDQMVALVLNPGESDVTEASATEMAAETGRPVTIYEVACHLQPPPAIGWPVDPLPFGWVELGNEPILVLPIAGLRVRSKRDF